MPGLQQTMVFTCGLTLSLKLLKYVVWNYWNMYDESVPRNTASQTFPHLTSSANQEYYSTSRLWWLTVQSHQTVRVIGTVSRERRHLTLPFLPSICMKMEEIWDMDLPQMWELNRGALFVCWAAPLIDCSLHFGKHWAAIKSKYNEDSSKQLLHDFPKEKKEAERIRNFKMLKITAKHHVFLDFVQFIPCQW